jgi:hypothetical protein
MANVADPFGHGFCLIALNARGYDALLDGVPGTVVTWPPSPPDRDRAPVRATTNGQRLAASSLNGHCDTSIMADESVVHHGQRHLRGGASLANAALMHRVLPTHASPLLRIRSSRRTLGAVTAAIAALAVTFVACSSKQDQCSAPECLDHCGRHLEPKASSSGGCADCPADPDPHGACSADAGGD